VKNKGEFYMLWWQEDLKTGYESVDQQHKNIFQLADCVMNLSKESKVKEVTKTFQVLLEYTESHFKDEEALMRKEAYSSLENHIKLHQHFIDQLGKLMDVFKETGITEDNLDELKFLMVEWLMNHIHTEDKKFIEKMQTN
jgi:hemerythrin